MKGRESYLEKRYMEIMFVDLNFVLFAFVLSNFEAIWPQFMNMFLIWRFLIAARS